MLTGKEYVEKLRQENEPLFRASELQIKHYYESNQGTDELIDNFTGRMVNERMNMEEISREIAVLILKKLFFLQNKHMTKQNTFNL